MTSAANDGWKAHVKHTTPVHRRNRALRWAERILAALPLATKRGERDQLQLALANVVLAIAASMLAPTEWQDTPPAKRPGSRDGTRWRLEVIDRRWLLSRWLPVTEQWMRVGDYSSRMAAVQAAYDQDERA